MKKKILSIALGLVLIASGTNTFAADKTPGSEIKLTPNQKAIKEFNRQFKDLNPTISTSTNGFILQSAADGHKITSAYDKKGNWVYTITNYPTENLSKEIIDIVEAGYNSYGYSITTMKKIDQPGRETVYIVNMNNRDSFKVVGVSNNDVEVIHDFKKI